MVSVLDSSAALAVLFDERGQEFVIPVMEGALISSVNAFEVLRVLQRRGSGPADARFVFHEMRLKVHAFDFQDAAESANIGHTVPHLSFGDCACIALAHRESADQVLTADRIWAETNLGVKIRLIR